MRYQGLLILFISLFVSNDIKAQKNEFEISGYVQDYKGNLNKGNVFYYSKIGTSIMKEYNPFVDYSRQKLHLKSLNLADNKNVNPFYYSKYTEINFRSVFSIFLNNISDYNTIKINQNQYLPNTKLINKKGIVRGINNRNWCFLSVPSNNYAKKSGTLRGNRNNWDSYITIDLT